MRTYAIGDIHGHLEKLQVLQDLIDCDRTAHGDPGDPVVHVGDLMDRGPDSRGVVDHLMAGIAAGRNWVVIKGNHDRMFTGFVADPAHQDPRLWSELSWLHPRLGGAETLASYGVASPSDRPVSAVWADAQKAVPQAHLDFLQGLPVLHQRGDAVFVHAGIRPQVPLDRQIEDDLVWIRDPFLQSDADHGPLIVHGHTVVEAARHYGNRLNLDTGAGYGKPMTAVILDGRQAWNLTPAGRVPLLPG